MATATRLIVRGFQLAVIAVLVVGASGLLAAGVVTAIGYFAKASWF